MFKKIKHGLKGVKQFVDKKIKAIKDILSDRDDRLAAGIIVVSIGVGLIISAYAQIPT